MDQNVWKDFPEVLWIEVLARLPVESILRLRAVSKTWNSLFHDSNFFQLCHQVKAQPPFCVRNALRNTTGGEEIRGFAAYNPASNSWHFWSYSHILGQNSSVARSSMSSRKSVLDIGSVNHETLVECGGAGGLLLLEGIAVLHLVNPISKSVKQIQLIPELLMRNGYECGIVGMVVDDSSGSYKILAFHDRGEMTDIYVYESKSSLWEICCTGLTFDIESPSHPTLHNGSLYCLIGQLSRNFEVIVVDRKSWRKLPAQFPDLWDFACLFERRGRLMLAGGQTDEDDVLLGVDVWQLDEMKADWVEVMTMPTHLVQDFVSPTLGHDYFECVANEDYLCVTGCYSSSSICDTVMCSFETDSWWFLPACPKTSSMGPPVLLKPRLDVVR